MCKILVTGGAGMIGSNLVKELVRLGYNVYVIDNLWRGKLENLLDENNNEIIDLKNCFFNLDLSEPGICSKIIGEVDYVFHLADIVAGINYIFSNQGNLFRQNILINTNLINSVRSHKLKGFIYVGTACSFPAFKQSNLEPTPLKEKDLYPAEPESAYGWSKLMGQYETILLEREAGIATSTLMFHNVFGSPTDYSVERSQVIPSLIRKAIRYPQEPFVIWGSGSQSRAFLHVDDAVRALIMTMQKGLGRGVIQIGPAVAITIKQIAKMVVEISGKDIEIQYDLSRPEGDKARCADYTKAKKILGWEPQIKLMDGLERLYSWIENMICIEQKSYLNSSER